MSKYIINGSSESIELNTEEIESMDIQRSKDGRYHLIDDNTNYLIDSIETTGNPKSYKVIINGNEHLISIKDEHDQLIDQMGMDVIGVKKLSNITAPMPGLILEILVEEGQAFEEGEALLILEAMKMENVIKADGAGVVKAILGKKGDTVEKSQIIIDLEEQ